MAESRRAATKPEPSPPTKRTVLKGERVIVLPAGIDVEHAEALLKRVRETVGKSSKAALADAWIVVGEYDGASKDKSIEAYAGKPGTPDAKPGDFKAVPAASFAGGKRHKLPPKPLIESESIE